MLSEWGQEQEKALPEVHAAIKSMVSYEISAQ